MKAITKDAFREIKSRFKIFLSIMVMSFLGVGFYASIKATGPSMQKTANKTLKDVNFYDIAFTNYQGLTEDDLKEIKKNNKFENVVGVFDSDALGEVKNVKYVFKVLEINNKINKITVTKGRLPKNNKECLIDENEKVKIGATIKLDSYYYKETELKVVGYANSPLYLAEDRDQTKLGSGEINYNIYIDKDNINVPIYSSIYATLKDNYNIFSSKYEKEINKIKDKYKDDYIVLKQEDNYGFKSYSDDTNRINNIGKLFPFIFFLIATLISLTSMTRMVEEQRGLIGILKALGYTGKQISRKYIIYASLASIIGGFLGLFVAMNTIPQIIYSMYQLMYKTGDFLIDYNWKVSIEGMLISYLCIIGATYYACKKELEIKPALLMRPKAPKAGKRVLLEYIPFIWNRLNFTTKVTFRNMFRYKKRFLMTIIGIGGCTGLIFAGYALQGSVKNVLPYQYGKIFKYDINVIASSNLTEEDKKYINDHEDVKGSILLNAQSAKIDDYDKFILMTVNDDIYNFINIRDYKTKEKLDINKGLIVSQKMASLNGIEVGDYVNLINKDDKKIKIKVTGICENYLEHYAYISEELYEEKFKTELTYNSALINSSKDTKKLNKYLLENEKIINTILTKDVKTRMDKTLDKFGVVVWVLIICAGALALAVLYNLANVNINERIRELATIKVLGFYNKEVYEYVERETKILTLFGIILGFGLGYCLNTFILKTCELDVFMFPTDVGIMVFVYASVITVIFTMMVNVLTYFSLKKIDMIESLKSVE
ncbi:MAG: ABC transporter permease [Bacilli bacterium]|nr:ABC transporter permease [Bacilli bacterium]